MVRRRHGAMAKVRWTSSNFEGEGSSKKCPAMMGNRAGRGGSDNKKGKGAS